MHTIYLIAIIVHVTTAGALLGLVGASIVYTFAKELRTDEVKRFKLIRHAGTGVVGLTLISGLALAVLRPEAWQNPFLWVKLALIVLDGIIAETIIVKRTMLLEATAGDNTISLKTLQFWSIANAVVVTTIIVLGTLMTRF